MCNDGFGSRSLTSHPQSAEPLRLRHRGMRKLLSPPSEMGDGSSVRNTEVRQQGRSRGSCRSKFISIFKAYRWWQRPACAKGLQSHHLKTKHRASMNSFLILMPWTKSIQSEKLFPAFVLKPWHDVTSITEVQTRTRQQPALHPAAQHASRYPADI